MNDTVLTHGLLVARSLHEFVEAECLPGTGISADAFWSGFSSLLHELAPRNARLLKHRDELQAQVDAWHRQAPGAGFDAGRYKAFLQQVGYLLPEGAPFAIDTANVDAEIVDRFLAALHDNSANELDVTSRMREYVRVSRDDNGDCVSLRVE